MYSQAALPDLRSYHWRATRNPLPHVAHGEVATPYEGMILIEGCSGSIEVSDVELDGSGDKPQIGGEYGDTGRQIPAVGLVLRNNLGSEVVRNIHPSPWSGWPVYRWRRSAERGSSSPAHQQGPLRI